MADISVTPKHEGGKHWVWALVAVVCVLALMFWLASQEEATPPAPVVETDTTAVETPATDTLPADSLADTTGVAP